MKDAIFLVEFDGIPKTGIAIHHISKRNCSLIEKREITWNNQLVVLGYFFWILPGYLYGLVTLIIPRIIWDNHT